VGGPWKSRFSWKQLGISGNCQQCSRDACEGRLIGLGLFQGWSGLTSGRTQILHQSRPGLLTSWRRAVSNTIHGPCQLDIPRWHTAGASPPSEFLGRSEYVQRCHTGRRRTELPRDVSSWANRQDARIVSGCTWASACAPFARRSVSGSGERSSVQSNTQSSLFSTFFPDASSLRIKYPRHCSWATARGSPIRPMKKLWFRYLSGAGSDRSTIALFPLTTPACPAADRSYQRQPGRKDLLPHHPPCALPAADTRPAI